MRTLPHNAAYQPVRIPVTQTMHLRAPSMSFSRPLTACGPNCTGELITQQMMRAPMAAPRRDTSLSWAESLETESSQPSAGFLNVPSGVRSVVTRRMKTLASLYASPGYPTPGCRTKTHACFKQTDPGDSAATTRTIPSLLRSRASHSAIIALPASAVLMAQQVHLMIITWRLYSPIALQFQWRGRIRSRLALHHTNRTDS